MAGKSPLHPSALRLKDMTVGRSVIMFNRAFGIMREGVIASKPFVKRYTPYLMRENGDRLHVMVTVRLSTGRLHDMYLADIGVIPHVTSMWNQRNFTIDARKRHLLPELDSRLQAHNRAFSFDHVMEDGSSELIIELEKLSRF